MSRVAKSARQVRHCTGCGCVLAGFGQARRCPFCAVQSQARSRSKAWRPDDLAWLSTPEGQAIVRQLREGRVA